MPFKKSRSLLNAGEIAPHFELKDLQGNTVALKQVLSEGPAVLAFFKVSCPVCQFTFPFLERLANGNGSVRIIGVSQDKPAATRDFNREYGVSFATVLDESAEGYPVSNAYGISHVPALFVIEQDGVVSSAEEGFSKTDIQALGGRLGVAPFQPGEYVPEWKAG